MSQVSENPFEYSDTNKRYHTYDYYLRHAFGEKCAKITLDGGFTCPNIDGTKGVGGCIYCSGGSRSRPCDSLKPLAAQYAEQIERVKSKWDVKGFIPYLQSYTNSHTGVDNFRRTVNEIASLRDAVMIDIATRADCLENEKIEILREISERIPVTLELGLQSSDDKTAELINRCHTFAEFEDCVKRIHSIAPRVRIAVHIINGLPKETRAMMLKTVEDVCALSPHVIKIHLLHVIEGTPLAEMYKRGEYIPLEKEEYVSIVCDQIEIIPKETVIERVTGDGMRDSLLAPLWSLKKVSVINDIDKELYRRGTVQGIKSI